MRKTYSKPEIVFEGFTLSTNIAGDCENKTNTPSQNQCGLYLEGVGTVFILGMTGCEDFPVEDESQDFNGICYHVPSEGNNLFNS